MLIPIMKRMYANDMEKFIAEVEAYSDEAALWSTPDGIENSAGTLALHIEGNLKGFFGALLGGTDYVRDRDKEFAARDVPKEELIQGLKEAAQVVQHTLDNLTDDDLAKTYAVPGTEEEPTGTMLLVYLLDHLAYHLGQINYHRRLLDS